MSTLQCQCRTAKGVQCQLKASKKAGDNPKYCFRHQKCTSEAQAQASEAQTKEKPEKKQAKKADPERQCHCFTKQGKQCQLKASTKKEHNPKYCSRHQNCQNPFEIKETEEEIKPQMNERLESEQSNRWEQFSLHLNFQFHKWISRTTKVIILMKAIQIRDKTALQELHKTLQDPSIYFHTDGFAQPSNYAQLLPTIQGTGIGFYLQRDNKNADRIQMYIENSKIDHLKLSVPRDSKGDAWLEKIIRLLWRIFYWEFPSRNSWQTPNWNDERKKVEAEESESKKVEESESKKVEESESKKVEESGCKKVQLILDELCEVKVLTGQLYHNFYPYRTAFLASFLRHKGGCFGGGLQIRYNTNQKDTTIKYFVRQHEKENWNQLKCANNNLEIINLSRRGGYYDTSEEFHQAELSPHLRRAKDTTKHANVLLINHQIKTIFYFEPKGKMKTQNQFIEDAVQKFMEERLGPAYTFVRSNESCPYIGPQKVTGDSFCGNWAMLIPVLHSLCPQIDIRILQEQLLAIDREKCAQNNEQRGCYLRNLMSHFHCFMWNWAKKHKVIDAWDRLSSLQNKNIAKEAEYLIYSGQSEKALQYMKKAMGQPSRAPSRRPKRKPKQTRRSTRSRKR
jgi:hypothetical protein